MNIPAGVCASVWTCPLVPTYRLNPGVPQLLSVLARQLAQAEDGLPLLVAGVGRIGEVLGPLHQRLQLAAHALGRQGVQVLPQALHAALQERRGGVGNMESLSEHLKDCWEGKRKLQKVLLSSVLRWKSVIYYLIMAMHLTSSLINKDWRYSESSWAIKGAQWIAQTVSQA